VCMTTEESYKEMKRLYPNAVYRGAIIVILGAWWSGTLGIGK
jgi:hypothetical protein